MNVSVVCGGDVFNLNDCDSFKNYMYSVGDLGDIKRVFTIHVDMECIYHQDLETHKKENICEIITEYMVDYSNYTIEVI